MKKAPSTGHICSLILALLIGVLPALVRAEESGQSEKPTRRFEAGIRVGVWHNLGETPAPSGPLNNDSGTYKTNVGDNSFVIEGHLGVGLMTGFQAEFSLGAVNRGSVTLTEGPDTDIGNLLVYSILAQLKVYPLATSSWRLQPFLLGGGGVHFGRRSVQFSNAGSYYYGNWDEDSGTNFNYVIGGGLDYRMSPSVGFDFVVKYMPIRFSKSLVTIEDYDAISFTLGVKYLYGQ